MERVHRLATYGSLAPGRPNAHQLQSLKGRWISGHVHGTLVEAGWGAALGYPALVLAPTDPAIELHVFESIELPLHWARLDDFEGPNMNGCPSRSTPPKATWRRSSTLTDRRAPDVTTAQLLARAIAVPVSQSDGGGPGHVDGAAR